MLPLLALQRMQRLDGLRLVRYAAVYHAQSVARCCTHQENRGRMDAAHCGRAHVERTSRARPPVSFAEPLLSALANSQVVLFQQDLELRYTWIHNLRLDFAADDVLGKRDDELLLRRTWGG